MEKLIAEHRKLYGDFEVIDYVDEEVIQKLRDDIDVESPITLHWTWNYASGVAELRVEDSEQRYSRVATGFRQKRSN